MNLKKILVYSLVVLGLVVGFSSKAYAAPGCCSGTSAGREGIRCQENSTCLSGQNICDTSNDRSDIDIDKDGSNDLYNPDCFVAVEAPEQVRITDFGKLFSGVVAFLLLAAFILAFFFLILGGISWLTSGGDKGAVENARNKIIAALVGLVIVAATWALFQLVGGAIGFNILQGFEVPRLF